MAWALAGGVILVLGAVWLMLVFYGPLRGVEPWVRVVFLQRGAVAVFLTAAAVCFVRAEKLRRFR